MDMCRFLCRRKLGTLQVLVDFHELGAQVVDVIDDTFDDFQSLNDVPLRKLSSLHS